MWPVFKSVLSPVALANGTHKKRDGIGLTGPDAMIG
jgi:hypothetical protein